MKASSKQVFKPSIELTFNEVEISTVFDGEKKWYIADDVRKSLGIATTKALVKNLQDDSKRIYLVRPDEQLDHNIAWKKVVISEDKILRVLKYSNLPKSLELMKVIEQHQKSNKSIAVGFTLDTTKIIDELKLGTTGEVMHSPYWTPSYKPDFSSHESTIESWKKEYNEKMLLKMVIEQYRSASKN